VTWIPEEERTAPAPRRLGAHLTLIDSAGGNNLRLHVFPASPDHPHSEMVQ
jgi:hypothetical protein